MIGSKGEGPLTLPLLVEVYGFDEEDAQAILAVAGGVEATHAEARDLLRIVTKPRATFDEDVW